MNVQPEFARRKGGMQNHNFACHACDGQGSASGGEDGVTRFRNRLEVPASGRDQPLNQGYLVGSRITTFWL